MKKFEQFKLDNKDLLSLKAGSGGPGVDSYEEFISIIMLLNAQGHEEQADLLWANYANGMYDF